MIGYASRTGTKRNLAAMRKHGWRLLVSAEGVWRNEGFPYCIDNGAWTAFLQGRPWDEAKFIGIVNLLGAGADFIVLPDIVAGGMESFEISAQWIPRLEGVAPLLFPVQNGQPPELVAEIVEQTGVGIFVGGDTEWKETTLPIWGHLKAQLGCYLHVGRMNSRRKIKLCAMAGADSFDGTSLTKWSDSADRLSAEIRQTSFLFTEKP